MQTLANILPSAKQVRVFHYTIFLCSWDEVFVVVVTFVAVLVICSFSTL